MASLYLNEDVAGTTARHVSTGDIAVRVGGGIRVYLSVDEAHTLVDQLQDSIRVARTIVADLHKETR
ncbi:hypothetical protein [Rhodococcus aetherivorans]|uniref:hypothetical protein n=1 Tax=Rhodococcus aetherivorans TaxID=191292 RepID=UPI00388D6167